MANMGAKRLVIVSPRTELTDEAKQGAAHAQSILANAKRYSSLTEFLANEGEGLRIAFSGKDARLKSSDHFDVVLKSMTSDSGHRIHDQKDSIYLFFGAEDDGLSAEEMATCHHVCRLPTFSDITSLNLSHAVLLGLYMLRNSLGQADAETASRMSELTFEQEETVEPPASFQDALREWLLALGFDLSSPRISIEKTLNRIFLSRAPTKEEIRILNTVLHQTVRKLKNLDENP